MTTIPKIIHLTHFNRSIIPKKVWDKFKIFAKDYKVKYYSNQDCIRFITQNYSKEKANIFRKLATGAHKADLFRYCVLYKLGGIYLDIKIVLVKNINTIFNHINKNILYTVLSGRHIFQGVIATYPDNNIFCPLINDFNKLDNDYFKEKITRNNPKYHYFTKRFYQVIKNRIGQNPTVGVNKYNNQKIILFQEKNVQINKEPEHKFGHWNIFNINKNRVFKSRYDDFPWA
tara:strand:+ start:116 stop:805 length:690 start_codon:yes stop_codon:yes gene_type:complete